MLIICTGVYRICVVYRTIGLHSKGVVTFDAVYGKHESLGVRYRSWVVSPNHPQQLVIPKLFTLTIIDRCLRA